MKKELKWKFTDYALKNGNLYLQGIEPNESLQKDQCAPTMGSRSTYGQFNTVWGEEPRYTEPLTFTNWFRTLTKEIEWGRIKANKFEIIVRRGE